MQSDRAQLSAMESTLDDLIRRVTEIESRYRGTPREDVAQALLDTERTLVRAGRQLAKTMRLLRP